MHFAQKLMQKKAHLLIHSRQVLDCNFKLYCIIQYIYNTETDGVAALFIKIIEQSHNLLKRNNE